MRRPRDADLPGVEATPSRAKKKGFTPRQGTPDRPERPDMTEPLADRVDGAGDGATEPLRDGALEELRLPLRWPPRRLAPQVYAAANAFTSSEVRRAEELRGRDEVRRLGAAPTVSCGRHPDALRPDRPADACPRRRECDQPPSEPASDAASEPMSELPRLFDGVCERLKLNSLGTVTLDERSGGTSGL